MTALDYPNTLSGSPNEIKPHLRLSYLRPDQWVCLLRGDGRGQKIPGYGGSPEGAYLDWAKRNKF